MPMARNLFRGTPEVVDAGRRLVRLWAIMLDNTAGTWRCRRSRRSSAPTFRSCSGSSPGTPSALRGADADRRKARRRVRAPADLRRRNRRLHRRLALVRAGRLGRDADRRARRPGHGCCADEPGDALDHRRDLSAEAAGHGDRDLGRRLRARARDRPARRRPPDRAAELALDLLRQRPGGGARDRGELPADHGVEGRDPREPRPAGARDVGARPLRAHLRVDRGQRVRRPPRGSSARRRRGRARVVRADRAAAPPRPCST